MRVGEHRNPARNFYGQGGKPFMAQQVDPVCGMQVEEQSAAGQADYEGRTYYFCSTACQREFEANPAQYAKQSQGQR
jgi:P-type Cu+ transporter